MKVMPIIAWGLLICCNLGCQREFSNPEWDEAVLSVPILSKNSTRIWLLTETPIRGGFSLLTGRPAESGCDLLREFRSENNDLTIDLSVARHKIQSTAIQYFSRMSYQDAAPLFKKGNAFGFQYQITKSLRPRSDPEGGGGLHDRRITYLTMQKNVTVIVATIYSPGAKNKVDVSEVVKEINMLVGDW